MKRPRRRQAQENSVEMVLNILESDIEPEYGSRRKYLLKHGIHKQPNNSYHKTLYRIVLFLEESRGNYDNSMESMIRDYLDMLYSYYWRFNRTPSVNQLSPATNNQIKFQEWIHTYEAENEEDYWRLDQEGDFTPIEFKQDFNLDIEMVEV